MVLLLLLATPPTSPADAKAQLQTTLAGPACSHATLQVTQSANVREFWKDRERFEIQGTLRDGVWEDMQVTKVEDLEPKTDLETGAFNYFRPGIGKVPGDPNEPLWKETLPSGKALGNAWVWSTSDYTLSLQAQGVALSAPKRIKGPDGSVEAFEWSMQLDPDGLPTKEEGSLKAKRGAWTVDVQWNIEYNWSPC